MEGNGERARKIWKNTLKNFLRVIGTTLSSEQASRCDRTVKMTVNVTQRQPYISMCVMLE